MKKITELTEQEILNLTEEEIQNMIKFRMAEEGIKMIEYPKQPDYFKIDEPNIEIFQCGLFGQSIVFSDQLELKSVIDLFKTLKSATKCDYNYNLGNNEIYYLKPLENNLYGNKIFEISSKDCYSKELYDKVYEFAKDNAKLKTAYESELKEYDSALNECKYIKDEIYEMVNEVGEKYYKLADYCRRFKNDYMPLADSNESIAMNFLDKAYSLTDEQKSYVLENYTK